MFIIWISVLIPFWIVAVNVYFDDYVFYIFNNIIDQLPIDILKCKINAYTNYVFYSLFYLLIFNLKITNVIVTFVVETTGISTASSDGSCDSFSSSNSNFSGSEVRNSSPMCHYMDSNLSDSSTSLDYTVKL